MGVIIQPTQIELDAWAKKEALVARLQGVQPTLQNVQQAIVEMNACFVGVTEIGKTNTGYLVNRFADDLSPVDKDPHGNSWCVNYAQAVYLYVSQGFGRPDLLPYNTPGSQALAQWAESKGIARTKPKYAEPGSHLVWRDGDGGFGHDELLDTTDSTIYDSTGGNTSGEGSRDGGAVCRHRRVPWAKWGALTPESDFIRSDTKRWLRCIIPVSELMRLYWSD